MLQTFKEEPINGFYPWPTNMIFMVRVLEQHLFCLANQLMHGPITFTYFTWWIILWQEKRLLWSKQNQQLQRLQMSKELQVYFLKIILRFLTSACVSEPMSHFSNIYLPFFHLPSQVLPAGWHHKTHPRTVASICFPAAPHTRISLCWVCGTCVNTRQK